MVATHLLLMLVLVLSPLQVELYVVDEHTTFISVQPLKASTEMSLEQDIADTERETKSSRNIDTTDDVVDDYSTSYSDVTDFDGESSELTSEYFEREIDTTEDPDNESSASNSVANDSEVTSEVPTTKTERMSSDSMNNEATIAWAPYSDVAWAPYSDVVMSSEEGRWISRDKVQILNTKPAFTLPTVSILENNGETNDEYDNRVLERKRRGSHSGTNSLVAQCGGTFRDLYGVIESPDFPLYYPNNKKCIYDIEVPENHTIKITCDEKFIMQGGSGGNCSHDYMMVDFTGDTTFSNGQKFCGVTGPSLITNGTRMTIKFKADDLFRYQGFSCRYRALQPNGIAVIGSFGNSTETTKPRPSGNNFLQVVQCPQAGDAVAGTGGDDGPNTGTSLYSGTALFSGMWNGQCGNQNRLPPLNRVVGGYMTEEHEYPWVAAVLKTCNDSFCHICGATIISEEWILTGAHCMKNVPMEDLGVLVGDHNLYTISNSQKFIKVKEKVVHPDYNMKGNETSPLNNDIGLLRLEYPIIFTSQISPLCLPALGETGFGGSAYGDGNTTELDTAGLDIVGKNATVLGWGTVNDDGEYSESLRGVEVEILHNNDCNVLYGIMTETMMCTSGANGRGTCYGDSGGPAIVRQPDGKFVQVGILSFGALAGCEQGYPSGQVLVHKYIDWIQAMTGIAFGN